MPADALGVLAPTVAIGTVNAGTVHPSLDLKVGTPLHGLWARVTYWGGTVATTGGTAVFHVLHGNTSPAGTLLASGSVAPVVIGTVASGVASAGELFIPVNTRSRYISLQLGSFAGASGTINYRSDLVQVNS